MRLDTLELSGNALSACSDQKSEKKADLLPKPPLRVSIFPVVRSIQHPRRQIFLAVQLGSPALLGLKKASGLAGGFFYSFVTTGMTMGFRWVFLKR